MASQLLIVCSFTATVVFGACVDKTNPDTNSGSIRISLTPDSSCKTGLRDFYSETNGTTCNPPLL